MRSATCRFRRLSHDRRLAAHSGRCDQLPRDLPPPVDCHAKHTNTNAQRDNSPGVCLCLRYATRAVIGTLRPTEQRRAICQSRQLRHLVIGTIRPTEPGRKPLAKNAGAGEAGSLYGAEGARTPDLCNANAALSQLSYSPAVTMNASGQPSPVRSITKAPIARGSPHAGKTNRRGRSKQAHCSYAIKTHLRPVRNTPSDIAMRRTPG